MLNLLVRKRFRAFEELCAIQEGLIVPVSLEMSDLLLEGGEMEPLSCEASQTTLAEGCDSCHVIDPSTPWWPRRASAMSSSLETMSQYP